ncbi:cathepsin L-like [Mya arenaria]|uniref:cathepsin L-like n=1 Tax=Mya arenaria TaxID=6604 RepID=UPI0022E30771|nr:cathepsin L-like [Mya arenaria]
MSTNINTLVTKKMNFGTKRAMASYAVWALISFAVLSLGSCRYAEDEDSARNLFKLWQKEYEVQYDSYLQAEEKFHVFWDNIKYINNLNKEYSGETEFALNHFAAMTTKEFKQKILMPKRQPPVFDESRYIRDRLGRDIPDSFDWVEKGRVTPVKDQGDVGTCWAFSAVENIEGQWIAAGQKMTNLSVEQVVECDSNVDHSGNSTHADCGVFGGWPYLAYQYVMKAGGMETGEDYSYCCGLGGKPGTCSICPAAGYNWTLCGDPTWFCNMTQSCGAKINPKKFVPGLKVVDWKAIDEDENTIAEQMMTIGPLSVAMDATLLQHYHKGVFDPIFCSKTALDHAVLLVGWGVEKDLFSTKPYWRVKNSWGAKWGENGYFRMLRGSGICGINTAVTTAVLQKP